VRFAARQLVKSPGFAIVVILALSMGIGAASAIFSVLDAVLLRPLPFDHQERLVYSFMKSRQGGSLPSSVLSYYDERAQLKTFDALAGYSTLNRINLEMPTGAVSLPAVKTTDNFFDVFKVAPVLGRTYLPGEDQPGRDNVAVLSYDAWQIQFQGSKGTAAGWLLSIAFSRILASVVTIRTSADFLLMAAMTAGLLLVGLITSLGPARSAASVEPMRALRAD
jgi:hypothetical protein